MELSGLGWVEVYGFSLILEVWVDGERMERKKERREEKWIEREVSMGNGYSRFQRSQM